MVRAMRNTALFCVMALLLFSLPACDAKEAHGLSRKNPVTIRIWHYYNGAQLKAFDELVAEFNDTVGKEKGVFVETHSQGNVEALYRKTMDALDEKPGAEVLPDMLAAYTDMAYAVRDRGAAANVEHYLSPEELASFVPAYLNEGWFDQEDIYLYPIAKSTESFFLNVTDWEPFAKATGASEESFATWEGICAVSEQYYNYTDGLTPEIPDDGKAFFGRDALDNYLIVGAAQLGKEVFSVSEAGVSYQLDREVFRRLWDNYYVPYINGWFDASGRFRSDDAKMGRILSFVGATPGAAYFPSRVTRPDGSVYDIACKVYPVPDFEGEDPYAVQQGAGIMVTKSDERKEYASVLFLKWFTSSETSLKFCLGSGYLPVMKAYSNSQVILQEMELMKKQQIGSANFSEEEFRKSPLCQAVLEGVDTMNRDTLYSNQAFQNGNAARTLLKSSFAGKAEEDRARVNELVGQGLSRSEAAGQFDTDENFEAWYQSLTEAFDELKGAT